MLATEQIPGVYRTRAGDALVTALNDGYIEGSPRGFRGIDPAETERILGESFHPMPLHVSVNVFAIQRAGRTALVDAGAGHFLGPTLGRLPANLRAAGIDPASVDTVLLTHLHADHSPGLVAADGTAVFPNAEVWVHADDAAHWLDEAKAAQAPEKLRGAFDLAMKSVAPYRDRLRTFTHGEVFTGVEAHHFPGHSPGHCGYRVEDLLIWGDIVHLPDVQSLRPEVTVIYDFDPAQAADTRRRVFDMTAAETLRVAGMHMHFPAFSYVTRSGAGYRFVPQAWSMELTRGRV